MSYKNRNNSTIKSSSFEMENFVRAGITFYNHPDDVQKEILEYVLSTDPAIRIKNTVDLIKRVYGYDSMDKSNITKKIYFK